MNSAYFRTQVELALSGAEGLANNLPVTALKGFSLAVPPISEAVQIAAFLDVALHDSDTAINKSKREIDLLNELRTRLIADVVTGKLDVRGVELPALGPSEEVGDVFADENGGSDRQDVMVEAGLDDGSDR